MKKILLLGVIFAFTIAIAFAQTKKIAHASHSGKARSLHHSQADNLGNPYPSKISVPVKDKSGKIEYKIVPYRERYKYIKPVKPKVIQRDSACQKAGK